MTAYLSGAEIIADARLRLAALPPDQGILVVEGSDDVRIFGPHSIGRESVLPCGGKPKLLDAYRRLRPGEETRIAFVVDCDYDVPIGRLRGHPNLVLTEHVDVEADLLGLGVFHRLVQELIPAATLSERECEKITAVVLDRAGALAEAVGRFRLVSTRDELGLRFENLVYRRYRSGGDSCVDLDKLGRALHKTNVDCGITPSELIARARAVSSDVKLRNGKDTIEGSKVVLHEDFNIKNSKLQDLDVLLRLALSGDTTTMARWSVVRRLAAWQASSGRVVLKPALVQR